jgi:preprotein translocase SecE subunit
VTYKYCRLFLFEGNIVTEQPPKTKRRKLRSTSETMRERAVRTAAKTEQTKQKKPRKVASKIGAGLRKVGRAPVWKPFRLVGRILVPRYFRASWRELRQVTWPDGKQTRQLTSAVILFSVVFGALVAAFDYGLDKLFKQVIIK